MQSEAASGRNAVELTLEDFGKFRPFFSQYSNIPRGKRHAPSSTLVPGMIPWPQTRHVSFGCRFYCTQMPLYE